MEKTIKQLKEMIDVLEKLHEINEEMIKTLMDKTKIQENMILHLSGAYERDTK